MLVSESLAGLPKRDILFAVLGFYALYVAIRTLRTYLKLRHIPGPPGTGWTKWWLVKHQSRGTLCCDFEDVAEKYGPIARIAPEWVLVSDPSEIRRIWSVHSGYERSPWYRGFRFDPNSDSILTANDNKDHHRIRSKLLPGYGGKGLGNQETLIDEAVINFTKLINREYLTETTPKPMDGARVFLYFTQDLNSVIEFGKNFGYMDQNRDINGVIEALEFMMPATNIVALFPTIVKLIQTPLFKPLLPKPTDKQGIGRLLGVIQSLVEERYTKKASSSQTAAVNRPRDVLQSFVESPLSQKEVNAEALVHILGGTDTTATALRVTLFYLTTKPSAYRALQSEVDSFIKSGRATRPVISDAEAKSLPYLQAVIKEGLRIWPPIMGMMAKVSHTDDIICGKKVPAHTNVAWGALAIMKNKELFGQDAEHFEPGRWISAAKEAEEKEGKEGGEIAKARLKEMEAVQSMVFVQGSRWECLGRKLAVMEMGKVLFELFHRYDFSMANPVRPFEWRQYAFTLHENMNFIVTKRETTI